MEQTSRYLIDGLKFQSLYRRQRNIQISNSYEKPIIYFRTIIWQNNEIFLGFYLIVILFILFKTLSYLYAAT